MVYVCCVLLFWFGDYGVFYVVVIVFLYVVEVVVVEVVLQIVFVIGVVGVVVEWVVGVYCCCLWLGNIKVFIDSVVVDYYLVVVIVIDIQCVVELCDVIFGGGEVVVGCQEVVGYVFQSSWCEDVGFFLGMGIYYVEIGVIKYYCVVVGNDIYIVFNVVVGYQGVGLMVVLQMVLYVVVGYEEGVLMVKNIDFIDLYLVVIVV